MNAKSPARHARLFGHCSMRILACNPSGVDTQKRRPCETNGTWRQCSCSMAKSQVDMQNGGCAEHGERDPHNFSVAICSSRTGVLRFPCSSCSKSSTTALLSWKNVLEHRMEHGWNMGEQTTLGLFHSPTVASAGEVTYVCGK